MIEFKHYIAKQFINKTIHFKCDCIFPMDFIGIIKDYEIINDEIIFKVLSNDRIIDIGENHPKMTVEGSH